MDAEERNRDMTTAIVALLGLMIGLGLLMAICAVGAKADRDYDEIFKKLKKNRGD